MSANQDVTLPGGTVIGYLEPWLANPGMFNGWVSEEPGVHVIAAEGVSENLAHLAVVRAYLVQEIKVQHQTGVAEVQDPDRAARIRAAFDMQKGITEEKWRLRGLELPAGAGPQG